MPTSSLNVDPLLLISHGVMLDFLLSYKFQVALTSLTFVLTSLRPMVPSGLVIKMLGQFFSVQLFELPPAGPFRYFNLVLAGPARMASVQHRRLARAEDTFKSGGKRQRGTRPVSLCYSTNTLTSALICCINHCSVV